MVPLEGVLIAVTPCIEGTVEFQVHNKLVKMINYQLRRVS